MTSKVFIDTSAWLAYSFKGEKAHKDIVQIIDGLIEDEFVICTSNEVIGESITRLVYDANLSLVNKFIHFIQHSIKEGYLVQFWTDQETQNEAFSVVTKFIDHKLSYVDAISYVFIKRFNIEKVVTLDSDFKKIGISSLP